MPYSSAGILAQGYHPLLGGVYVTKGLLPPHVPVSQATRALVRVFEDVGYVSDCDLLRLIAFLLTPAMKLGGVLKADAPILYIEADAPGAGKSYTQNLIPAFYDEEPYVVTVIERGVGDLGESVAQGMANGRLFIKIDNVETELRSPYLASATTHRRVQARVLYRSVEVHPHRHIFMANSNGASITPELLRRFAVVRIQKQPVAYEYNSYDEGDVLDHVRANQSYYLGCIFSVIREWIQAGKPRTGERRHSFVGWAQSLGWIMQNIFGASTPLFADYGDEGEAPRLRSDVPPIPGDNLFAP